MSMIISPILKVKNWMIYLWNSCKGEIYVGFFECGCIDPAKFPAEMIILTSPREREIAHLHECGEPSGPFSPASLSVPL